MDVDSPDHGHAASYLRLTPEYTVPLLIHKLCQTYGFRHEYVRRFLKDTTWPRLTTFGSYDDLCRHLGYGDVNCPPAAQDIYRIGVDGKQPLPPVFLPVVTPRDVGHCTEGTHVLSDSLCWYLIAYIVIRAVFCGTKPRKRRRLNTKPTTRSDDARKDTSIDDSQREQAATIRSSPAPSGDCKYLAMVLQEMRCPQLSEGTLSRGLDGKKIWSEDGRSKLVAIGEIGLNERVLAALQRASTLRSALQQCKDRGWLAYDEHGEGLTVIQRSGPLLICEPEIQLDALRLLCFLSPNALAFDPEYVRASYAECLADADRSGRRVFRELLPALLTWTSIAQRAGASEALLCTLIEAIMNGYRACPSRQCGDLTDIVARLGNPALPAHLSLTLAWTQSYLLREKCQYEESDRVSQAAIDAYAATDVRTACGIGHLYLSKAENAILRNDLEGARRCADMFDLPTELTSQSDMTWHMARLKWTVNARICRFSGQFEEAKRYLEICLKYCRNQDSTKAPYVLRLLADVFCELKCPETAEQLLKAPLEENPPCDGRMSTTCRRLTTSLANSIAQQGRFDEALTYVQDVEAHYDQQQASNPTNELEHFYTKTMHMIIAFHMANFDESLRVAGQALDLAERYRSFRPNNFYRGFVLRYRAMIRLQQANQDVTEAANCVAQPRHYLAGMGTYELEKMDREEKAQLALLKGAYAKVHDP